jgi:hypothetical protein
MLLEGRLSCKIISKGKHNLHTEAGEIMETKLERISELSMEHHSKDNEDVLDLQGAVCGKAARTDLRGAWEVTPMST